jgi:ABC-type Fe3+-siderophore transport system permease subunit
MVDTKRLIADLLGAVIAVVWIAWALLFPGNMVGLVIAIDITVLCGTLSGGLYAISADKNDYKEVIGWLLGASIGMAWMTWAMLCPGNMVGLVVAIAISIIFGTLSGGLLGKKF